MKILRITKGYWIDTEEGHQEIVGCTSSGRFVAHNYDGDGRRVYGKHTHISYLTASEILAAERSYSGNVYDRVEWVGGEV